MKNTRLDTGQTAVTTTGVPKLQQEVDNISENIHCWATGHWLGLDKLVVAADDDKTLSEYLILCHKKSLRGLAALLSSFCTAKNLRLQNQFK